MELFFLSMKGCSLACLSLTSRVTKYVLDIKDFSEKRKCLLIRFPEACARK